MLNHLSIRNFTTVDLLELELHAGLTTVTGETGAGKSVILDALGQALGDRSASNALRDESRNAEISATFLLLHERQLREKKGGTQSKGANSKGANSKKTAAKNHSTAEHSRDIIEWLAKRDLCVEPVDNNSQTDVEIILRRVITPGGRSRAYINGVSVNIADLKWLGEQLVDLHSQHEHQSLLQRSTHQKLLDNFAGNDALLKSTAELAEQWQHLTENIDALRNSSAEQQATLQLLEYQVKELEALVPVQGEATALAAEQKQLANAEAIVHDCHQAVSCCASDRSNSEAAALPQLQKAIQLLQQQQDKCPALSNSLELLQSASIQLQEAELELRNVLDTLSVDPERLAAVERRLDALYTIARKHDVEPDELSQLLEELSAKLASIQNSDASIEQLLEQQRDLQLEYNSKAKKLSSQRTKAAKKMASAINQRLDKLKMSHCQFEIALEARSDELPNALGRESIELLISTVPGKPAAALSKIASGGELSRISLAIQVVSSQTSRVPTLVFDEVDVGIGGAVAEVVGNLLRELAGNGQILCVTHLAQVAVKGQTQLLVSKQVSRSQATTSITTLDKKQRTAELARMIGGLDVTDTTIAHAKNMLESA